MSAMSRSLGTWPVSWRRIIERNRMVLISLAVQWFGRRTVSIVWHHCCLVERGPRKSTTRGCRDARESLAEAHQQPAVIGEVALYGESAGRFVRQWHADIG